MGTGTVPSGRNGREPGLQQKETQPLAKPSDSVAFASVSCAGLSLQWHRMGFRERSWSMGGIKYERMSQPNSTEIGPLCPYLFLVGHFLPNPIGCPGLYTRSGGAQCGASPTTLPTGPPTHREERLRCHKQSAPPGHRWW